MKSYYIIFFILSVFLLSSYNTNNKYVGRLDLKNSPVPEKKGITKVVIDAGHGGKDPGCLGSKAKEKDVVLSIALLLGQYIEKNCPDVKVIYTRHEDVFVELFQRAEIANKNKADLFISLHCNSSPSSNAYGVETYVMGLNKSEANLNVAKKENSSILLEDDYKKNYNGFDPNSPEAYIIFSLYQNTFLDHSLNLASKIEKQVESAGRFRRGVKQAGFLVLYKTTMPGMLIETGFLTNKNEEEFLMTSAGQNKIAYSVFKAFKEYKREREGRKEDLAEAKSEEKNVIIPKKKDSSRSKETLQATSQIKDSNKLSSVHNKIIKTPNHQTSKSPIQKIVKQEQLSKNNDVIYKVQFMTSPVKKNNNSKDFKNIDNIDLYVDNGIYKYTVGNENDLSKAKSLLTSVKEKGFKDAFIIAFYNGQRLKSINEAINIQKKYAENKTKDTNQRVTGSEQK